MDSMARLRMAGIGAALVAAFAAGCGGGGGDSQAPSTTRGSSAVEPPLNWTVDAPFENQPGKAEYPSVAIASSGETIAVFAQQTESRLAVHAVHGNANSARNNAPRILDRPDTSAQAPYRTTGKFQSATQVAMNPATGDAIAVWSATAGSVPQVWAAAYSRAADIWHAPVRLDTSSTGASYPVVAMNAQGNAVAAWTESASVNAAYFSGGSWRNTVRLSALAAQAPQAGIDAAGNALVAWVERDASGNDNIMASDVTAAGPAPARILDTVAAPASMPSVAVAPNGNALVAWVQDDGSGSSILASLRSGGTWSAPTRIESRPGSSYAPSAALNNTSGFVAWEQADTEVPSGSAYAARMDATGAWSAPVLVYNRGGAMPVIRLRDNGDAMLVWLASHTQFATWSAATSSWSPVVNLAPYNCGNGHSLAMDAASGKAVAAWIPSNCARNNDVYGAFYR